MSENPHVTLEFRGSTRRLEEALDDVRRDVRDGVGESTEDAARQAERSLDRLAREGRDAAGDIGGAFANSWTELNSQVELVTESAQAFADVLTGIYEFGKAGAILNDLSAGVARLGVDLEALEEAAGPIADGELLARLGQDLAQAGISTEEGATALKAASVVARETGRDFQQVAEKFVKALTDSPAGLKDFGIAVKEAADPAQALSNTLDAMRVVIGGADRDLRLSIDAYAEYEKATGDAVEGTQQAVDQWLRASGVLDFLTATAKNTAQWLNWLFDPSKARANAKEWADAVSVRDALAKDLGATERDITAQQQRIQALSGTAEQRWAEIQLEALEKRRAAQADELRYANAQVAAFQSEADRLKQAEADANAAAIEGAAQRRKALLERLAGESASAAKAQADKDRAELQASLDASLALYLENDAAQMKAAAEAQAREDALAEKRRQARLGATEIAQKRTAETDPAYAAAQERYSAIAALTASYQAAQLAEDEAFAAARLAIEDRYTEKLAALTANRGEDIGAAEAERAAALRSTAESLISSGLTTIAGGLAEAAAGQEKAFERMLLGILGFVGDTLIALGIAGIAGGALGALGGIFAGLAPPAAIGIGAGLVAIGTAMKAGSLAGAAALSGADTGGGGDESGGTFGRAAGFGGGAGGDSGRQVTVVIDARGSILNEDELARKVGQYTRRAVQLGFA